LKALAKSISSFETALDNAVKTGNYFPEYASYILSPRMKGPLVDYERAIGRMYGGGLLLWKKVSNKDETGLADLLQGALSDLDSYRAIYDGWITESIKRHTDIKAATL
jgi:hypothetical protein